MRVCERLCVHVCVCERERKRERDIEREYVCVCELLLGFKHPVDYRGSRESVFVC